MTAEPRILTAVTSEPTRSLHRKLAQVMYEAERIPKNGTAPREMGGYKFVQVGDAADFIRKALAEKVITMMPVGVQVTGQVDRATKSGGNMTTVDLVTTWRLTDGESGESIEIQSFGAGADGGDKYSGKAMTSAMKYALLAGFLLSTGEDSELGRGEPPSDANRDGSLIGTGVKEKKVTTDFLVRESPEGPFLGFRIKDGLGSVICEVRGPLAVLVAAHEAEIVGQRIQVWGSFHQYEPPAVKHPYRAFRVTRMQGTFGTIPVPEGGPGDPPQAGAEAAGVTESAPDEAQALPVPPEAAGVSSPEPAALSPGSAPDDQCDSASPYGDNLQCELLAGHRGPHKVLSLAFPETWTDR